MLCCVKGVAAVTLLPAVQMAPMLWLWSVGCRHAVRGSRNGVNLALFVGCHYVQLFEKAVALWKRETLLGPHIRI